MSNLETKGALASRSATLKMTHVAGLQTLTASVPPNLSAQEFAHVTSSAFALVSKLTAHPCMSGKIKFVIDEEIFSEVTKVDLGTGQLI